MLPNPYEVYIGLEAGAASIRNFEPIVVPGLLLTADYAREIFRNGPIELDPDGVQAAEDASAAAVGQHIHRENVLSYSGRGQDDPFGILLWLVTRGGATGNLIAEGAFEYRRAQFVLAEEGELAAVLQVEEIGHAVAADALGASGAQQQTVDISEPGAVLPEHGPGQDVPLAAVRAGAVQIRHFGEHAGWRPGEQPGQGGDRFGRLVGGGPAETPVIHQE